MTIRALLMGGRTFGIVTLTAQIDANQVQGLTSGTAVWQFHIDGTVWKDGEGAAVQVNASTDWVIPNGAASGQYDLKWDQVSGDAPTNSVGNIAENTWTALSSQINVGAFAGGSYETGIVTVSIRFNGGATLASANFEWEGIDVP